MQKKSIFKTLSVLLITSLLAGSLFGYLFGRVRGYLRHWDPSMDVAAGQLSAKAEHAHPDLSMPPTMEVKIPQLKVDQTSFDFGILEKNKENEQGEHDFVIENAGNAPLSLKEAGKDCMCTSFSISQNMVLPGEKAIVKVKWDASRSGGAFDQSVRIASNDPKTNEFTLNIRGLYTSPLLAQPNHLTFYSLPLNTQSVKEFRLFGFEKEEGTDQPFPLEILETKIADSEHFEITLEKASLDRLTSEEKEHELFSKARNLFIGTITVKEGLPLGAFQDILQIKTNSPTYPLLEVIVEGNVVGTTTLTGNRYDHRKTGYLDIGPVSASQTTVEKLRMTVIDKILVNKDTVRVESVRPNWLNVDFAFPDEEAQKKMPAKIVDIAVTIPSGSPMGNFTGPDKSQLGEIVLKVGATPETEQTIVIPVQFAVIP